MVVAFIRICVVMALRGVGRSSELFWAALHAKDYRLNDGLSLLSISSLNCVHRSLVRRIARYLYPSPPSLLGHFFPFTFDAFLFDVVTFGAGFAIAGINFVGAAALGAEIVFPSNGCTIVALFFHILVCASFFAKSLDSVACSCCSFSIIAAFLFRLSSSLVAFVVRS